MELKTIQKQVSKYAKMVKTLKPLTKQMESLLKKKRTLNNMTTFGKVLAKIRKIHIPKPPQCKKTIKRWEKALASKKPSKTRTKLNVSVRKLRKELLT